MWLWPPCPGGVRSTSTGASTGPVTTESNYFTAIIIFFVGAMRTFDALTFFQIPSLISIMPSAAHLMAKGIDLHPALFGAGSDGGWWPWPRAWTCNSLPLMWNASPTGRLPGCSTKVFKVAPHL